MFEGQCFCISGNLSMTHAAMEKLLKSHGAKVAKSMTKQVTHLLAATNLTTKAAKAAQTGVEVVDEEYVLSKIGSMSPKSSSNKKPTVPKATPTKKTATSSSNLNVRKGRATRVTGKRKRQEIKEEAEEQEQEEMEKEQLAAGTVEGNDDEDDGLVHPVDPTCSLGGGAKVYGRYDAMLNQTNIGGNNNKFYTLQLLQSGSSFYTFTRWGRIGETGQTQLLGSGSLEDAKAQFEKKFKDKTGNTWADRANFQARAKKYTLIKIKLAAKTQDNSKQAKPAKKKAKKSKTGDELHPQVKELMKYIYTEAKGGLLSKINVTITTNGISTPLGVLDVEQVERCEKILERALQLVNRKASDAAIRDVSSEFYTNCPHKSGRVAPPLLDNLAIISEKSELLQLMKDCVVVAARSTEESEENCLHSDDVTEQYRALGCQVTYLEPSSDEFKRMATEIQKSQLASHGQDVVRIKNIFKLSRKEEIDRYTGSKVGGERILYHGSRITNWVGLLSRGILLPKIVVSQGIKRTDPGWLGHGIYFGNADTAFGYAGRGQRGTGFFLVNTVALGKPKDFSKITYGLNKPPKGFDSCRGVPGTQFYDEELVIYDSSQFFSTHLVEFDK